MRKLWIAAVVLPLVALGIGVTVAATAPSSAKSVNNLITGSVTKAGQVNWYKQWIKAGKGYTYVSAASGSLINAGGYKVYFYDRKMKLVKSMTVTKALTAQKIKVNLDHFYAKVIPVKSGAKGTYKLTYKTTFVQINCNACHSGRSGSLPAGHMWPV